MESANKINTMAASAVSEDEFKKVANKVSFITIVQNVLLSVFKLFAGIFAHSNAMISDAVHSASDVFSTIIVIIGVKLASKESDKEHPYGHERLECVAAIVLSIVLLYTGIKIGSQAVTGTISIARIVSISSFTAILTIIHENNAMLSTNSRRATFCQQTIKMSFTRLYDFHQFILLIQNRIPVNQVIRSSSIYRILSPIHQILTVNFINDQLISFQFC